MSRALMLLVACALIGAVLGIGVLWSMQRRMIFPGAYRPLAWYGPSMPPGVGEGTLRTPDGVTLRMLWRDPQPGAGVVVSFHGNGSMPEPAALRFSRPPWSDDGWGFIAIAFRGYPGSTGTPSGAGILADGRAALAEARRRWPGARILLQGHSLGTAVAVAVGADRDDAVAGVYLEAPFSSMSAMASRLFYGVPFGPLLRDPLPSVDLIGHIDVPVVIVHGSRDTLVPPAESVILAAAGHHVERRVVDADHGSVVGAADASLEPFFTALVHAPR